MNGDDNRADDILRFFLTNDKGNGASAIKPLADITYNLFNEFRKSGFNKQDALLLTVELLKASIIANAPKNE